MHQEDAADPLAGDFRDEAAIARRIQLGDDARHQNLELGVPAIFGGVQGAVALAAAKGRSRREREQIRGVHRDLQRMGVISTRQSPAGGKEAAASSPEWGDDPFGGADDAEGLPRPAAAPFRDPDRAVIRGLLRRLAEALHPDKVQDERDKATRTEVMKEITVAYRERDFARLVEIERAWAASAPVCRA